MHDTYHRTINAAYEIETQAMREEYIFLHSFYTPSYMKFILFLQSFVESNSNSNAFCFYEAEVQNNTIQPIHLYDSQTTVDAEHRVETHIYTHTHITE